MPLHNKLIQFVCPGRAPLAVYNYCPHGVLLAGKFYGPLKHVRAKLTGRRGK